MDFGGIEWSNGWTIASVAGAAAVAGLYLISSYNRLSILNARCAQAFADVDVQLQHRHAILPNLVELLKSAKSQDLAIIDAVAKARAAALGAITPQAKIESETALSLTLQQAILSIDRLPDVNANEHYRHLRAEIVDCENKIAAARRFFNLAVAEYNAQIGKFPSNIVGMIAGREAKSSFELGEQRAQMAAGPALSF